MVASDVTTSDAMVSDAVMSTKILKLKVRGLSMWEIIAALAIVAIVSTIAVVGINNSQKNAKMDLAYTEQTIFATDIENILQDLGALEIDEDVAETVRKSLITEYLMKMQTNYLHTYLNMETLTVTSTGFELYTKEQTDPWGAPYLLVYNTAPAKTEDETLTPGDMMIISGGPNMEIDRHGYKLLEFGDDNLLMVDVKETRFGN